MNLWIVGQKYVGSFYSVLFLNAVFFLHFLCSSVLKVLENLPLFIDAVETLPINLKQKLLFLMCKRGLVTDSNISKVSLSFAFPFLFHNWLFNCWSISCFQVLHKKVTALDLSECEVGDSSLAKIAAMCPHLRKIDINSSRANRIQISDEGMFLIAVFVVAPFDRDFPHRCASVGIRVQTPAGGVPQTMQPADGPCHSELDRGVPSAAGIEHWRMFANHRRIS